MVGIACIISANAPTLLTTCQALHSDVSVQYRKGEVETQRGPWSEALDRAEWNQDLGDYSKRAAQGTSAWPPLWAAHKVTSDKGTAEDANSHRNMILPPFPTREAAPLIATPSPPYRAAAPLRGEVRHQGCPQHGCSRHPDG